MLGATTSHVEECPDLGPECASSPPPVPYRHHVKLFLTETNFDASYGLTPWLAIDARFGFRVVDITPTYFELDGAPKRVDDDIHHHDETLVGLTDPWLVARLGAASGKLVTTSRLGFTLPLGNTVEDPYALGARGLSHEHTQLGTGTFVPIVGLGLAWIDPRYELSLSAVALFSLYENDKGFRAPSRSFVSSRMTLPLLESTWRPYATFELAHEGRERWHGVDGAESFVRNDLLVGAGLGWRFAPPWEAQLGLRVRAASLGNGATFEYPGIVMFGLATSFGGPGEPPPHHHSHEHLDD
ncbi:MAG: hypothetical protein JWM74_1899 [Myxococcaceae bacterium]|nr:hypothetical protein [Myxococcaceae bacterium]